MNFLTYLAMKWLCFAMSKNSDLAWAWHCNVAMHMYSEIPTRLAHRRRIANMGAARFMGDCFGINVKRFSQFQELEIKWSKKSAPKAAK